MLDRMPAEVLGMIVGRIRAQSDLKSLCEVSKHIAEFVTPYLYGSIDLHASEELGTLGLRDLIRKIERCSKVNVKFAKSICLRAPFHNNLRARCPHYRSGMPKTLGDGSDVDDTGLHPFHGLFVVLDDLLGAVEENKLQSLSLDLGSCVRNDILHRSGGYWIERQKRIQSISLITDGRCPASACVGRLDLRSFTSIRSLSWKGLQRGDHLDCLANFINSQTEARGSLRTLELDLIGWARAVHGWYYHQRETFGRPPPNTDNFFATSILGIQPNQQNILFPSLETLLLADVAFSHFENELGHSFNMMNLSTLHLRNCLDSVKLLGTFLQQGVTLKLKSFELVIDWDCLHHCLYDDQDSAEAQAGVIFQFLASFQGLEDLFVLLTQPVEWYLIANGIGNHHSTLKRLVIHERDAPKGLVVDGGIPWHNSGEALFYESKLSCFGTSGPMSEMELSFKELPMKPRCKILHLRISWIDYHRGYEQELQNLDLDDSDFEDLDPAHFWGGRKFPSYPRTEMLNEASQRALAHPSNHSSSSKIRELQGLIAQEPQNSTRTRKIANRSEFSGLAHDFVKFASWVFGPEGIPELRILAWGDFSHDGRWGESNVLLCRDQSLEPTETNFRTVRDSDFDYWDLIDENMDMLSACTPDRLFYRPQFGSF